MCGCLESNFVHLNIGRTKVVLFPPVCHEFGVFCVNEIGPTEVNSNL